MKKVSMRLVQAVCILSVAFGIALGSVAAFADEGDTTPAQMDYKTTLPGK
jgi:hypothetical protein